jgi:hypothetical protein
MNLTMKYGQLKIVRPIGKFRFFIGICASCLAPLSCIGPNAPENVPKELSGGYTVMAKLQTTGYARDVVVADSFAYIAQGQCGLAIVNVGDPQNPRLVSELINDISGSSGKVAYLKNSSGVEIVYLAYGSSGLASLEVTDKLHPTVLTQPNSQFQATMSMFIFKNFIFCSDSTSGVGIGDITDPKYPGVTGGIPTPGYSRGACVSSDSMYLLCAVGEVGMVMENISGLLDGGPPPDTLSGRLSLPGLAEDIAIKPGTKYACIACGPAGLQIVDYADTSNIEIVGSFATGGYAKEVCVAGDKAYLATETSGVQIIDISDVASPKRLGIVKTKHSALGITKSNGYVFAVDQYDGLIVIKIP